MAVNSNGILAWVGRRSAIGHPTADYELFTATRKRISERATATAPLTQLRLTNQTLSYRLGQDGKRVTIPVANLEH